MASKKHAESESDDEHSGLYMKDNQKYFNKNYSRELMAKLPEQIRNRTKLLLSLDDEYMKLKAQYEAAKEDLQLKYQSIYSPLMVRRSEIVLGDDVTEEEVQEGFPEEHADKISIAIPEGTTEEKAGVKDFWLNVLRHHVIIDQMITERDAQVLKHLRNITGSIFKGGMTVVFSFDKNEFFEDAELYKTLHTKNESSNLAIDRTEETKIQWNEGKDVTTETITKKQKNKKGAVRYITQTKECESFFNLFKPHEGEELEHYCALVMTLIHKIIPLAVEYYTGEAPDGSSDLEDDGMYDEEEEDE